MSLKIFLTQKKFDLLITSGGVSRGKYDVVKSALQKVGLKILFERVAIKPGKPMAIAKYNKTLIFCLPGNPVAAFICALIILRPSLGKIGGEDTWFKPLSFKTKANFKKFKRAGRTEFLRARFNQKDGLVSIYPHEGSGRLSSMSWSNGLIQLSETEQCIKAGDLVNFIPYQSFF